MRGSSRASTPSSQMSRRWRGLPEFFFSIGPKVWYRMVPYKVIKLYLISTQTRTPDKQPPLLRGDLVRVPQDVEDQQSTIQRLVLLEQPPTNIRVAILRAILNNDL